MTHAADGREKSFTLLHASPQRKSSLSEADKEKFGNLTDEFPDFSPEWLRSVVGERDRLKEELAALKAEFEEAEAENTMLRDMAGEMTEAMQGITSTVNDASDGFGVMHPTEVGEGESAAQAIRKIQGKAMFGPGDIVALTRDEENAGRTLALGTEGVVKKIVGDKVTVKFKTPDGAVVIEVHAVYLELKCLAREAGSYAGRMLFATVRFGEPGRARFSRLCPPVSLEKTFQGDWGTKPTHLLDRVPSPSPSTHLLVGVLDTPDTSCKRVS